MKLLSLYSKKSGSWALACGLVMAVSFDAQAIELKYSLAPEAENSQLGTAMVGLGDVDADGIGDFAVSDQYRFGETYFGSGIVYVVSGADGSAIRAHEGEPASSQLFGGAMAALDADGDGVLDLAVGAPGHSENGKFGAGAVWVFSGADGSVLSMTPGAPGSQFGSSLAMAGDQNGDGTDDLFVGAPMANGSRGEVVVQSGLDGAKLGTIPSPSTATSFGVALATLGDVDGDGRPDVAVGEPGFGYYVGRVLVFRSTDWTSVAERMGSGFYNGLGQFLAPAADADGDGSADVMIGSYSGGTCLVASGSDLGVIADLSRPTMPFFHQIVPSGSLDADGDGVADWLVGMTALDVVDDAPYGGIQILSGADGSALFEAVAETSRSGFGRTLALIPGLGFAGGEWALPDEESGGCGAVHVWEVEVNTNPDSDGDGVPDSEDSFPNSILDPTVIVGSGDSGVENRVDDQGVSIADLLSVVGDPADAKSHGAFMSGVVGLVNDMRKDGTISRDEAKALVHAAVVTRPDRKSRRR